MRGGGDGETFCDNDKDPVRIRPSTPRKHVLRYSRCFEKQQTEKGKHSSDTSQHYMRMCAPW